MAVFKCKMCGGDLSVIEGQSVCECEYCGTKQTLPRLDDERRLNLYNRASHFRQRLAFDKAAQIYETIVQETPDDAEAHWSLVLCRYGIEYVEDPSTFERIPTCHRASYDPITEDIDYKEALKYADPIALRLYQKEAAYIDRVLKGIMEISAKEEPYDVFICYKETDERTKERSLDSVKAQEVYDALTEKGYKVFFSRITLEGMLGEQYEPRIFAALNSAKVMLVITTKAEHVNSVWVKNEWSRYLKIMAKNKGRTLIPCYFKMDPYDLPGEFSNIQGQDMGKMGFMQDLVRGIGKLIPKQTQAQQAQAPAQRGVVASFDSLMKRIGIFLEAGDFDSADRTCDKILDADPENANAYIYKLLIEFREPTLEKLAKSGKEFFRSFNFKMALRFGGKAVEDRLLGSDNAEAALRYFISEKDKDKLREYAKKFPHGITARVIADSTKAFGSADLLNYFIDECGLDVNMTINWDDEQGIYCDTLPTYLFAQRKPEYLGLIKELINKGADINKRCSFVEKDREDDWPLSKEWTLLGLTVNGIGFKKDTPEYFQCRLDLIKFLTERGASLENARVVYYDDATLYYSPWGALYNTDEEYCSIDKKRLLTLALKGLDFSSVCAYKEVDKKTGEATEYSLLEMIASDRDITPEYFDILSEAGIKLNSDKSNVVYTLVSTYLEADTDADEKKALTALKRALELGANPDTCAEGDTFSESPLYVAANNLYVPVVKLLLEYKANPDNGIEATTEDGVDYTITALGAAIISKSALELGSENPNIKPSDDIIAMLLDAGADPNLSFTDKDGDTYTPMEYCFCSDKINDAPAKSVILMLAAHGGNANVKRTYITETQKNKCEQSLIAYAIDEKFTYDEIKTLLDAGADPNGQFVFYPGGSHRPSEIRTALDMAIMKSMDPQMLRVVELLLSKGASWDKEMMIQYQGKTIKKPVGKMKWDKMSGLPNDILKRLKALGWKPGLF